MKRGIAIVAFLIAAGGVAAQSWQTGFVVRSFGTGPGEEIHRGGSFLCTDQYCSRYIVGPRGQGRR
jgi:hypothetical protein